MNYKKVDQLHFETYIAARAATPESKAVELKSNGYRVRRLYYREGYDRIAYVQMRRNGEATYHISLAA